MPAAMMKVNQFQINAQIKNAKSFDIKHLSFLAIEACASLRSWRSLKR
jgi:hypothetical protein